MLSLMLGFPVALSGDKSWTGASKAIALVWIAILDVLIIAACCM